MDNKLDWHRTCKGFGAIVLTMLLLSCSLNQIIMPVPPTVDPTELKSQQVRNASETQTIAVATFTPCDFGLFIESSDSIVKDFFALASMARDAKRELLSNIVLEMKASRDRFATLPLYWCSSEYQRKLTRAMDYTIQGWQMSLDGRSELDIHSKFRESNLWLDAATDELKKSLGSITPKPK